MLLDQYQTTARTTAIYPNLGHNLMYPALGLCGECAEVLEKADRGATGEQVGPELGDVLWYVANLAAEAGMTLSELVGDEAFPQGVSASEVPRMTAVLGLCVAVGRVAEIVKKIHRDGEGQLSKERASRLAEALEAVLNSSARVAWTFGLRLEELAQANADKLASRKARGVLSGSGDHR